MWELGDPGNSRVPYQIRKMSCPIKIHGRRRLNMTPAGHPEHRRGLGTYHSLATPVYRPPAVLWVSDGESSDGISGSGTRTDPMLID
jgi:hypothetical protein